MTDEKIRVLRREITNMNETLRRKNVMLTALHYVWCSGGCLGGASDLRHEITEDVVLAAELNTKRLRTWWENKQHHERWKVMSQDERNQWVKESEEKRKKLKEVAE